MKKVLIITYYWPPAGGSGVQRWLKFSKYLPENGWTPIVYTPSSPSFEILDEDLLSDIPPEVEVWKTPIWEPYHLKDRIFGKSGSSNAGIVRNKGSVMHSIISWIRGNVFIPDPKVFWVKPSIKFLTKKISDTNITHIISTGPPHSMHLIALGLKKKFPQLKWIADFRDPWSEFLLEAFKYSEKSKQKHRKLEKEVLKHADITLTVSETWEQDFKRLGAKQVRMITNGYDEHDFQMQVKQNNQFVIGHFGLMNYFRNPKNLWKALNDLCDENPAFKDRLELRFAGNVDAEILQYISQFDHLKDKVVNLGYLTHKEVVSEYYQCSVLLLLLYSSEIGNGSYPGKIFEYFASKKPILAFGPLPSNVNDLMEKAQVGLYYSYDEQELKQGILSLFEEKNGFDFSKTEKFSRRNLTQNLVALLNEI